MHDPMTVAFNVRIPLPWKRKGFLKSDGMEWAKYDLATIWHVDPCKGPGGDDSCGWFMRSHHGDAKVLEKIISRFEFDWDRIYQSKKESGDDEGFREHTYFCGLFKPDGDPHLSVHGIVLNLFFIAASVYFECDGRTNWRKSKRFMRQNLFDILMFAENPKDSLFDGITRKFQKGCGEEHDTEERKARIRNMASCIYGWILRQQRPWYRHPKWHFHHWKIQCLPIQRWMRWLKRRCKVCGNRIRPSDGGVVSDGWSENSALTCGKCGGGCVESA